MRRITTSLRLWILMMLGILMYSMPSLVDASISQTRYFIDITHGRVRIWSDINDVNLWVSKISNSGWILTGTFWADSFWLEDKRWSEYGYYTTLQATDLVWINNANHVIPKENIYLKSTALHTIDGVEWEEAGIWMWLSSWEYVSMQNIVWYITRQWWEVDNAGRLGKYGDEVQIKVEIPAYTIWDSYVWTLIYTLYDLWEKDTPRMWVKANNVLYGDEAEIVLDMSRDAEGTVTIKLDNEVVAQNLPISGWKVNYSIPDLWLWEYNVEVIYGWDDIYMSWSTTTKFIVSEKLIPTIDLHLEDTVYGQTGQVVAELNVNTWVWTIELLNWTVLDDIEVVDGVVMYDMPNNLPAWEYIVQLTYLENGNYYESVETGSFTVYKATPTLTVQTWASAVSGCSRVIINSDATWQVNLILDGEIFWSWIVLNWVSTGIDICDINAWIHVVEVVYLGNENYITGSLTKYFTVSGANTQSATTKFEDWVTWDEIKVWESATVIVELPYDAEWFVKLNIGTDVYWAEIEQVDYWYEVVWTAMFEVEDLPAWEHLALVTYAWFDYDTGTLQADGFPQWETFYTSSKYSITSDIAWIIVTKIETLNISISGSVDGNDLIIDIEAPIDIINPVLVRVGDAGYYVNLINGTGQLILEDVAPGNHLVTATYLWDDKYESGSYQTGFVVYNNHKSLDVEVESISANETGNIRVYAEWNHTGDTLTFTINNSFGSVVASGESIFDEYDFILNMTRANITLNSLPVGEYTVQVVYNENYNWRNIIHSGTWEFTVSKINTVMTVREVHNVTVWNTVTVEVNLPDDVTWNIYYNCGSFSRSWDVEYLMIWTIDDLPAWTYNCTASYSWNGKYESSSTWFSFVVSKNVSTMSMSVDTWNDDYLFVDISLPSDTTWYVILDLNGVKYATVPVNGQAEATIPMYETGTYHIYASYLGDDKYLPSTGDSRFTFENITNTTRENTIVEVNATGSYYGDNQVIDVQITGNDVASTATWEVVIVVWENFYVRSLVNGHTSLSVSWLDVWQHLVTVIYGWNELMNGNRWWTRFGVTQKLDSQITIYHSWSYAINETPTIGVKVTESGNVNNLLSWVVRLTIDWEDYLVNLVNWYATLNYTEQLKNKTYTIHAEYLWYENYNGSEWASSFSTYKLESSVSIDVDDIVVGETAVVIVRLDGDIDTGTVTVEIGSEYVETVGIDEGKAVADIPWLTVGTKTVTATYNGSAIYLASSDTATFTVEKAPAPEMTLTLDEDEYYYWDIVALSGSIDAVGTVTILIDGNEIDTIYISDWWFGYELYLDAGEYELEVIFNWNDDYQTWSQTIQVIVNQVTPQFNMQVQDISNGVFEDEYDYSTQSYVSILNKEYVIVTWNTEWSVDLNMDWENVVSWVSLDNWYTGIRLASASWIPQYQWIATIELSNLSVWRHIIQAVYNWNDNYTKAYQAKVFNVYKMDTQLDMEINDPEYTREQYPELTWNYFTVYLTVNSALATGEFIVMAWDAEYAKAYTWEIVDWRGEVFVEAIDGIQTFTGYYLWDANHNDSISSGQTMLVCGGGEFATEYDGQSTCEWICNNNQDTWCSNPSNNTITWVYATPISVDAPSNVYVWETGGNITVTVPDDVQWDVILYYDNGAYSARVQNGKAIYPIDLISSSYWNKTFIIQYLWDWIYKPNMITAQVQVSKRLSHILVSSTNPKLGKDALITVTTPSAWLVWASINGMLWSGTIINWKAKILIPTNDLWVWTFRATIYYGWDDKYLPAGPITTNFTVSKSKPPIT